MKPLVCILCSSILLADAAAAAEPTAEPIGTLPSDSKAQGAALVGFDNPAVQATIKRALLDPMAKRDKKVSRFSRAPMPPASRRARILTSAPVQDAAGGAFLAFEVDERYGGDWSTGSLVGCVYPLTGAVYVGYGDDFSAAAVFAGKKADAPPATVCKPAPPPTT